MPLRNVYLNWDENNQRALGFPEGTETPRSGTFLQVAAKDVDGLIEAAKHYGESWYMRDGAGAFFMLARKWDRIEKRMKDESYKSIIEVLKADKRAEGMIDDIRDLRRYLMLIEAKLIELGVAHDEVAKGDKVAIGGDLHKPTLGGIDPASVFDRQKRAVIWCVDCSSEFPVGNDPKCPHLSRPLVITCALCGLNFSGDSCPCTQTFPPKLFPGTGWFFTIRGTTHGPYETETEAKEVYADNTPTT